MTETGFYVRIQREGKWINTDLADLSETEVRAFFKGRPDDELINWLAALQKFIKDIG